MSRIDKLLETSEEIRKEVLESSITAFHTMIENKEEELVNELSKSIQEVIDLTITLQENQEKEPIKYISFTILLSSIVTESYTLGINLYDASLFLDEVDAMTSWKPSYLFDTVEKDMANIETYLNTKFTRLTEYEVEEIKRTHVLAYMEISLELVKRFIPKVLEQATHESLKKESTIEVITGFYMEKQQPCYSWKVGT